MNQDMERFLNLRHPPERVTAEQAAWLLGISAHEIPILIAKEFVKTARTSGAQRPEIFFDGGIERFGA